MKASYRLGMIPVLLLFLTGMGATCGGQGAEEPIAPGAATGSWKLVSSMSGQQLMEPPQWDGELHVVGDRYSRFYVRRSGMDSVPFASFSDAGSWYTQSNGSVVLTVEFSSVGQAVGNQYRDKVALTNDGRRLVITGNDFREVWEVR